MQETESVLRAYGINGAIDEIALLGFGHINDSYKVKQAQNSFLLQKINSSIFQYYEALENNLNQLLKIEFSLFPIHKKAEGKYHLEFNAALWRLSEFVENSYSPFHPSFEETLEAVRGYGNFYVSQ